MPALAVVSSMMDAIMNELRIPVNNLIERTKIQAQMAYVYGDICAKQDWWWLVKKHTTYTRTVNTDTQAYIDFTGTAPITVTVTGNSTAITFSGTVAGSLDNFAIFIDPTATGNPSFGDFGAPYRLSNSVAGSATADLDSLFTGGSSSGVTFRAYQDLLPLPADCAKVIRMDRWGYRAGSPQRIGVEDMAYLKIRDTRVGPPEWYTVQDFADTGDASTQRMLWLHPYPDKHYKIDVWYKHQSAGDLSDIALPTDYQQVLNYGTLSRCYPIFLNDIERGQYYLALFNDIMGIMSNQQREYATDHPGINPSADLYRPRTSRRRAGSLGNLFDIYPSVP